MSLPVFLLIVGGAVLAALAGAIINVVTGDSSFRENLRSGAAFGCGVYVAATSFGTGIVAIVTALEPGRTCSAG